jgi:hypothetical protein
VRAEWHVTDLGRKAARAGCRRYLTLLLAVRAMLDAIITAVIRVFERFGRVSGARWPRPARLEQDSRRAGDAAAQALALAATPHTPRSRDDGTGRA